MKKMIASRSEESPGKPLPEDIRVLVIRGRYREAISLFAKKRGLSRSDRYHYGFALAKVGRYRECLDVWESIESDRVDFREQREIISFKLFSQLYRLFEEGIDSADVYRDACYLVTKLPASSCPPGLERILRISRRTTLGRLWNSGDYTILAKLVFQDPGPLDAALLAMRAKVSLKMVDVSPRYLGELLLYWLTAVHHPEISQSFGSSKGRRKLVRRRLIEIIDEFLSERAAANPGLGNSLASRWKVEKGLMELITRAIRIDLKPPQFVCTPSFAARFDLGEAMRALIGEVNPGRKEDERLQRYLRAFYTEAWESMILQESDDVRVAWRRLPPRNHAEDDDLRFAILLVTWRYGLHCLRRGDKIPPRLVENVGELLQIDSGLIRFLLTLIRDHHDDRETMHRVENFLLKVVKLDPMRRVMESLSLAMTCHSLTLLAAMTPSKETIARKLKKAITFDANNWVARQLQLDLKKRNRHLIIRGRGNARRHAEELIKASWKKEKKDLEEFSSFFPFFDGEDE